VLAAGDTVNSLAVWYLMRASGVVTTILLTAVFSLGIATTKRWQPARLPRFVTTALHRNVSLLAVVFLALHVGTAVVDPYAHVGPAATVVPFTAGRSPLWVGLGAMSLDLMAALVATSLLRRHIGVRAWRAVHWAAYLAWPLALAHGLGMGSDARALWLETISGGCVAVVTGAVLWRLQGARAGSKHLDRRVGHSVAPGAAS
jgi:methionine sulfoxide reductase heme-binding subunit